MESLAGEGNEWDCGKGLKKRAREVGDRRASVQTSSSRRSELGKRHAPPSHTLRE
jgi:hypothetical protein